MTDRTDGPATEWKPEGSGPHTTLAGNLYDPNVAADGRLNAGQGVGGTDAETQRQEGLEHIKNQSGLGSGSGSDSVGTARDPTDGVTGSSATQTAGVGSYGATSLDGQGGLDSTAHDPSSGVTGSSATETDGSSFYAESKPPASNPGADDATAGILSGSGGLSGTAGVNSPEYDDTTGGQQQQGTLLDTVKSYLGYGGASSSQQEARDVSGYDGTSGSGSGAGEAAAVGAGAGAGSALESDRDRSTSTTMGTDPVQNSSAGTSKPTDSDVTTGAPPTVSADRSTEDRAQTASEQKDNETGEGEQSSKKKGLGGGTGLENEDAIPTAGNEKLGKKHWGESKIVPENPKPENEAGVSSEEGQPDQTTANNTSANTGGAAPPGQSSSSDTTDTTEKEGLVDKIKDKLHLGHKS